MAKIPEFLQQGDQVAIVCPASFVRNGMRDAVKLLESWGLTVKIGETVSARYHQFAGDDAMRAADLQWALDDPDIKAIFAARGGYGTVRVIDRIDFSRFAERPKWVVGFSDITILHSHIQAVFSIPTIHGQMPVTIPDGTRNSLETLRTALFGGPLSYRYESPLEHLPGEGTGVLIGGNLALLASAAGSASDPDYDEKILLLEDIGEYFYAIDRMMWMLKRAHKLSRLNGLIVGGFVSIKDNDVPFGATVEEIILEKVEEYGYPVAFGFPAGHVSDNQALILGKKVTLRVIGNQVSLEYR